MIQCKGVTFGYENEPIYKDFNLTLESGSICGLLGVNGAGKTTLFKLLTGLIFPSRGEVRVLGYASKNREEALYKKMAYVGEELSCPNMSPLEYIHFIGPMYPKFSMVLFEDLCERFEIDKRMAFSSMSSGNLRKAWLAIALSYQTELLLLDEPSKGLDIKAQGVLRKALAQSAAEGTYILLSTHHVREVEGLLDYVVLIDRGGNIKLNMPVDEFHETFSLCHCLSKDQIPKDALAYQRTALGWTGLLNKPSEKYEEISLELIFMGLSGKGIGESDGE